jgi:acyl dehydratase
MSTALRPAAYKPGTGAPEPVSTRPVDSPSDRAPDGVLDTATLPQQALLYRLCGDRNPLHADPEFAATAGFPRPILHGLRTWGMVCKAIVDEFLDGDPDRVRSYSGKFAAVVFPGETLHERVAGA